MERTTFYDEIYEDIIQSIQGFEVTISVSGMTVFMITKILFRSIVLSISRTNAVSIKVL